MAPIFVGSNSDDTRIRSNRVGLAASTSDPGTASEGDIYYNSSNNLIKTHDGSAWSAIQGSGTVSLTASGSISNGQPVIVSSDGKAVGVTSVSESLGSVVTFKTGTNLDKATSVFDPDTNKVILQEANGAQVATISDTTVSFGATGTFTSNNSGWNSVTYDTENNKVVVAYRDLGNNSRGTAAVGTVSGTSISFGTPVAFMSSSGSGGYQYGSITFDDNSNKVVISYQDYHDNSYGKSIVGTVSGTSISFGSAVTYNSANTQYVASTFDSTNNKVIVAYNTGNTGYVKVGTVSGDSISFGSAVQFESDEAQFLNGTPMIYVPSIDKVLIAFRDTGSNYVKMVAGTVSGDSISFGSLATISSEAGTVGGLVYNTQTQNIVLVYRATGDNDYTKYAVCTIDGTDITRVATPVDVTDYSSSAQTATYDPSTNRVFIALSRDYGGYKGDAYVLRNRGTNANTENFIGFSDAAYTDGQTANIQIISSIDDAQSGLTTGSLHYVQNDGSLGTAASVPSIEAGTALSDTKIRIKS